MLGKTHKAFGVTSMAAVGLAYQGVTGKDITQAFIPLVNDIHTSVPMDTIWDFANGSFGRLGIAGLLIWGALMGASTPDIDQGLPIKHRGITHSLWIPLLFLGVACWVYKTQPISVMVTLVGILPFLTGFITGYLSHLVADAFSTSGIAWFYPLQGYRHYQGGSEVVKGNRFIFQPIYKVGQKFMGMPGLLIWTLIAIVTTVAWLLGIK